MKKVAIYCRANEDLKNQVNLLKEEIKIHKEEWKLTKVYKDKHVSGTSFKKRKGFNKMYSDAHNGKFDLVLIQNISRLSRNTVDIIEKIREFKNIGIELKFIEDKISSFEL